MFTIHDAEQLRGRLPNLKFNQTAELSSRIRPLSEYFRFYGFDKLVGKHECKYYIGSVEIANWRLATHYWQSPESEATVFVVHGLFDHVGIYLKLVSTLLDEGFSVLAVDLPGHGLSDGEAAAIDSFSDYSAIVEACLSNVIDFVDAPVYALGQSTGAAALLCYLLDDGVSRYVEKAVLLAPLVQPQRWGFVNTAFLALKPFIQTFPRSFSTNTHDGEFCEFLEKQDVLQPRYISMQWLGALREWVKDFADLPHIEFPLLILQGTKDGTVDWKHNVPKIQEKFINSRVSYIDGAMHHLVNESDEFRHRVFSEVAGFLKDELPSELTEHEEQREASL